MTERERRLEALLRELTALLDQMRVCPRCHFVPGPEECCRKLHAWPYQRLRARIRNEIAPERRPN